MLRLRMFAVKKSMKRSLVRAPAAAIVAGRVSSPARTSAGGVAMALSSVRSMGYRDSLGIGSGSFWPSPFIYQRRL